ncbi:hypothetical protein GF362_01075 [Candidatus Dojkabacteria bacterium]|nr:hypothetical protein [Candidatus Dojkabacteria bacterium]
MNRISKIFKNNLYIIPLLLFIYGLFIRPSSLFLWTLVYPFARGKSDAKSLGFFLYSFVFLLSYSLIKPKIKILKTHEKKLNALIYSLLIFLFLTGLVTFLFITFKYELNPFVRSVFVVDGRFDSTVSLIHIHTLKPILTIFLKILGKQDIFGYGTGLIFTELINEWLYFLIFILYIAFIILIIIKGSILLSKTNKKISLALAYLIFSYMVIKSIVDGGLFWFESIFGLGGLLFLLYDKKFKTLKQFNYFSAFLLLYCPIYILLLIQTIEIGIDSKLFYVFFPIFGTLIFCLSILTLTRPYKMSKWTVYGGILIGFIIVFFENPISAYEYSYTPIPQNSEVYITTYNKNLHLPIVNKEKNLKTFRYKTKQNTTIKKLLSKYNLPITYNLINIPDINCRLSHPSDIWTYDLLVLEHDKLNLEDRSNGYFIFSKVYENPSEKNGFSITFQLQGCHTQMETTIVNHLDERGFTKFFITDKRRT